MIVLLLPDETRIELADADARRLCEVLWDRAAQTRTAVVAVSIRQALGERDFLRKPIDVPSAAVERLDAALVRLCSPRLS